ncbi:hypothetical protein LINPERPRIM_LOCUS3099 [Linum perenne]
MATFQKREEGLQGRWSPPLKMARLAGSGGRGGGDLSVAGVLTWWQRRRRIGEGEEVEGCGRICNGLN